MNDSELDDGLDLEMDERLTRFARGTREPALPDEVAELPWTVQLDRPRTSRPEFLSGIGGGVSRLPSGGLRLGRLAVTLAVAGSFLLLVGQARTGGSGADIVSARAPRRAHRPPGAAPNGPEVVVVPTSGVVDDVMADYVAGAVRRAESDGAAAVIIQLDTLGGSEERDAAHRRVAALEDPDDRLGRAVRGQGRQRRHVHHARGQPGLHGPQHEHRRGLSGRGERRGHRRRLRPDRGRQGHE